MLFGPTGENARPDLREVADELICIIVVIDVSYLRIITKVQVLAALELIRWLQYFPPTSSCLDFRKKARAISDITQPLILNSNEVSSLDVATAKISTWNMA